MLIYFIFNAPKKLIKTVVIELSDKNRNRKKHFFKYRQKSTKPMVDDRTGTNTKIYGMLKHFFFHANFLYESVIDWLEALMVESWKKNWNKKDKKIRQYEAEVFFNDDYVFDEISYGSSLEQKVKQEWPQTDTGVGNGFLSPWFWCQW